MTPRATLVGWLDQATIREQEWRDVATGRAATGIPPDHAACVHAQWWRLVVALEALLLDLDTTERRH